jgi:glycerophosphoryl diester phosphodiesterase
MDAGVDYAEIDVRRTADGHHVLMHDSQVDRTTDGRGSVASQTLAQLQALAVRDPKRPQIPPDRIPTFGEVLNLLPGGRLNIYLDFKEGDRAAVARAIREPGLVGRFLIYDDAAAVGEWKRLLPDVLVITSPPEGIKTPDELVRFARSNRVDVLDGEWTFYSREMVEAAEKAGVKVWPDIQREAETPDYFVKVLERGFTGAQTDHPHELVEWLQKRALP